MTTHVTLLFSLVLVLSLGINESDGFPKDLHFSLDWETVDEVKITAEWMWFADGDGNIHNISLKYNSTEDVPTQLSDISFWLYTRKNIDDPQNITLGDDNSLENSDFKNDLTTKIIIHGWRNSRRSTINKKLVNAFLDAWDTNVVVVDWSPISKRMNYYSVRNTLFQIGSQIAVFIDHLVNTGGMNLEQLHIIGHSLGAHIAGYAGSAVKSGPVLAITGLDPALPLFSINDPENRLDASDATYVEVIHTDAGRLGFALPLGDVDFYPNKGSRQPGCGYDIIGLCAHTRAFEYFEETLKNEDGFYGKPCNSYDEVKNGNCTGEGNKLRMGGKYPKIGFLGSYLLRTGPSEPYGKIDPEESEKEKLWKNDFIM